MSFDAVDLFMEEFDKNMSCTKDALYFITHADPKLFSEGEDNTA